MLTVVKCELSVFRYSEKQFTEGAAFKNFLKGDSEIEVKITQKTILGKSVYVWNCSFLKIQNYNPFLQIPN